jgi:glucokinase
MLLAEAARAGDAIARIVFRDAGKKFGVAVASLINVFNPDAVVVGGGVSSAFDLFGPSLHDTVGQRAFKQSVKKARIEVSRLGKDAPSVGAALYARDQLNSP